MSLGQNNARGMLSELLNVEEGMSDWEVNFIESLSRWDRDFTPKQMDRLETIWERITDRQPASKHW